MTNFSQTYKPKPMGTFWICNECLRVFTEYDDAVAHLDEDRPAWIYEGAWGPDGMGGMTWKLTGHELHRGHSPAGGYYLNQQPHPTPWEDFARHLIVTEFRKQFERAPI